MRKGVDLVTAGTPGETHKRLVSSWSMIEANIVELLSVSLKFQGFEVYTATNGHRLDRAGKPGRTR